MAVSRVEHVADQLLNLAVARLGKGPVGRECIGGLELRFELEQRGAITPVSAQRQGQSGTRGAVLGVGAAARQLNAASLGVAAGLGVGRAGSSRGERDRPAGEGWRESSSTHTIGIRAPFRSRAVAVLSLLRATPLPMLCSRRRAAPRRAMP